MIVVGRDQHADSEAADRERKSYWHSHLFMGFRSNESFAVSDTPAEKNSLQYLFFTGYLIKLQNNLVKWIKFLTFEVLRFTWRAQKDLQTKFLMFEGDFKHFEAAFCCCLSQPVF